MIEAKIERAGANDVKSRLATFTAEIDRLSMINAQLSKEVEDIRRESAGSELKVVEFEKNIEALVQDNELLNVALDSKQTELVLLQRQLGQGTPKNRGTRPLAASTSRTIRPPSRGSDVTPLPSRSLSKSISHTALRPHSRASSVSATPTPSGSNLTTPRSRSVVTPTPMPLGASSKHNRTPDRKMASRKTVNLDQQSTIKPGLNRRSSLPVMKGSTLDTARTGVSAMTRVGEEDEMDR